MQKLDTREAFLAHYYTTNRTDHAALYMDAPDYVLPKRLHGRVVELIDTSPVNHNAKVHEDFAGLPSDFFVNIALIDSKVCAIDCGITRTAINNTGVTRENYWVFREANRFIDDTYAVPKFIKSMETLGIVKPELVFHFPHESIDDPTMLAYTPSHEYGKRDRQVKTKVGKYLTKFYSDVLTPENIRDFANGAKGLDVKFEADKEGFRRIYEHGPSSCMAGTTRSFDLSGGVHPVDVYEGEFKLAYIETIPGCILARAFVHEPSKTFVRAYGNEADTLATELEKLGYTYADSWEGAHLRKIEDSEGRIVLPYLDGDVKGVRGVSHTQWLITDHKYDYACDFTNGTPDQDPCAETCDICGGRHPEDESHWSEYHEQTICGGCIDDFNYAYTSRYSQTYVRQENTVYNCSNSSHYSQEYAEEMGLVETDNGDWYSPDDCVETLHGEWVLVDEAIEIGRDKYGAVYYANSTELDLSFIVEFDRSQPVALWHEDYIPEDTREAATLMDDYGTQTGVKYRTVGEILLIHGPAAAQSILRKLGYVINLGRLTTDYRYMTREAA